MTATIEFLPPIGNIDMIIELQAMNIEHFTEPVIEQIYSHKYVLNTTSYITLDTRK